MDGNVYDYVVVGAGPAGCVMAKTLSDGGAASVLLLEAGPNADDNPLIRSPQSNLYAHMPAFFWPGRSVPQEGVNGKDFALTGGRVAGGGSSVNGEMYVRPSPFVLDKWAQAGGLQWSPENALRRFEALERYQGMADREDVRGRAGRLHIRQNYPDVPALVEKLTGALEEAGGYPRIEDYNNPETPVGPFTRWQLYQQPDGNRASASVAFLSPDVVAADGQGVGGRRLTVRYRSTAVGILFDGEKRARGVRYIQDGQTREATAGRRVIVCAGLHSAKLLMLSGIGPAEVLKRAGVSVVHANPHVGAHLADDAYTSAVFTVNPKDIEELAEKDPYAKVHGGAFLPAPGAKAPSRERSIQIMATGATEKALYLSILCVNPQSRGTLEIQSPDPLTVMQGDFGFLTQEADVETLMAALTAYIAPMAEALARADPAYRLVQPSPETLGDEASLRAYVKDAFIHTYHDQCALRMGGPAEGAVNGWGEVYGVEGLTVADASIIPYHMDGNTSASAYLIGYTIAEHLRAEGL